MKKSVPRPYLSRQRQKLSSKLEELKKLYMQCCHGELIFHGQPGEVYRKCGKPNCRCVEGGEKRHGPYRIIRVFRDGKNTQVTLKQGEEELYLMAERYQSVVRWRRKIIVLQEELNKILDNILDQRTIWNKKDYDQ